ncbi:MAG: hypothetical protein M1587_07015 [Thaumarchaeota archaeon]|nr:hypothetical protein [Nitrososphaerota archaeon]
MMFFSRLTGVATTLGILYSQAGDQIYYYSFIHNMQTTARLSLLYPAGGLPDYGFVSAISFVVVSLSDTTGISVLELVRFFWIVGLAAVPLAFLFFRQTFIKSGNCNVLATLSTFTFFMFKYQGSQWIIHDFQLSWILFFATLLLLMKTADRMKLPLILILTLVMSYASYFEAPLMMFFMILYVVLNDRKDLKLLASSIVSFVMIRTYFSAGAIPLELDTATRWFEFIFGKLSSPSVASSPLVSQSIFDKSILVTGYLVLGIFLILGLKTTWNKSKELNPKPFIVGFLSSAFVVLILSPAYLVGSAFTYLWFPLVSYVFFFVAPFVGIGMAHLLKKNYGVLVLTCSIVLIFSALMISSYLPVHRMPSGLPNDSNSFYYVGLWTLHFSNHEYITGDSAITEVVQALTLDTIVNQFTNTLSTAITSPYPIMYTAVSSSQPTDQYKLDSIYSSYGVQVFAFDQ